MTIAVTEPAFTLIIRLILMTMTMLMTIILAMNFCDDEVSANKAQFRRYIALLNVVGDEEKMFIRKASNQRNALLSQHQS